MLPASFWFPPATAETLNDKKADRGCDRPSSLLIPLEPETTL